MFNPGWVLFACRPEKILMCLLHLHAAKKQKQNLSAPFIVNKQLLAGIYMLFSLTLPQTSSEGWCFVAGSSFIMSYHWNTVVLSLKMVTLQGSRRVEERR